MSKLDLDKLLPKVESIARQAGKLLLKSQKLISSLEITYKQAQGVASDADVNSEKLIVGKLKKMFPQHLFIAEEDFHRQKNKDISRYKNAEWCWSIDPLDGTHNFLNGHSYFAVCISLLHYGQPVLGMVYRPSSDELFTAIKGRPSFYKVKKKAAKNLSKLKSSDKTIKDCIFITGFATEKGEVFDQEFDLFKQMMGHARALRRFGSAALDICYVANGLWDGFWERGLAPWDVSAAGLIAMNAGLIVSDYAGSPFDPFGPHILVARPLIHVKMIPYFKDNL